MLSNHVSSLKPSATLALTDRVLQLRRSGIDIIGLNAGEPDFGTPENVCRAAKQAIDEQKTKYTSVAGILPLREAICEKLLKDNAVSYEASQISVGTGAKQPLFNAVFALCGEGDEVILPTPCWVSYMEMVRIAGGKPVPVPCSEEKGYALNLEAIEKAVSPRTKAIIINSPNNPTGAVYKKEELEKLVGLAVEHDFMIISDEVYEKLIYDGESHVSPASLSDQAKAHTVVINGFSKAYAMTGWRMGYAAGPKEVIAAINALQSQTSSNASSISQYAALEALNGPQDSVEIMRLEYDRRRRFLLEGLRSIPGISCSEAKGAFYLLPNVSAFFGKSDGEREIRDSFELAEYLLEKAHIAVVPGAAFEAPDNLRIAYSNSMENLEAALDRMSAALANLH